MQRRKVYQLNSELDKVTGIQRVLLDIHEALQEDFDTKIVGTIPYDKVDGTLKIKDKDYVKFVNPLTFRNSTVIIHERKFLPMMWILTHLPGFNTKCIYLHHNELYGNKLFSLFPKNIVAISDNGISNLVDYFGVDKNNITKIYNCVKGGASSSKNNRIFNPNDISILYPARVNNVKRQLKIVEALKDKLDKRIKILFAGAGPLYDELKEMCRGNDQFKALGFRNDIPELMDKSDFVMLFSTNEGLPISLIEGIKSGLPVICNDVGGNLEIARRGQNVIEVSSFENLASRLNELTNLNPEEYKKMSVAGKNIFEKYFTFNQFKQNYVNLINRAK